MSQEINLAEYGYKPNTEITISSELFIALLETLNRVEAQETKPVMLNTTPIAVGKNKLELKQHDSKSFFEQEPTNAMTILGAAALDLKFNLLTLHQKNIMDGIAVKAEELANA